MCTDTQRRVRSTAIKTASLLHALVLQHARFGRGPSCRRPCRRPLPIPPTPIAQPLSLHPPRHSLTTIASVKPSSARYDPGRTSRSERGPHSCDSSAGRSVATSTSLQRCEGASSRLAGYSKGRSAGQGKGRELQSAGARIIGGREEVRPKLFGVDHAALGRKLRRRLPPGWRQLVGVGAHHEDQLERLGATRSHHLQDGQRSDAAAQMATWVASG